MRCAFWASSQYLSTLWHLLCCDFQKKVVPGWSVQWSVGTAPKPNILGKNSTEQNNTGWLSSLWALHAMCTPKKAIAILQNSNEIPFFGRRSKLWRKRVSSMLKAEEIICLLFRRMFASLESGLGDAKCAHSGNFESIFFILLPSYRAFPQKHSIFIQERSWTHSGDWWKGSGATVSYSYHSLHLTFQP